MACHPKEEGHWFWNSIFLEIWNANRMHFVTKVSILEKVRTCYRSFQCTLVLSVVILFPPLLFPSLPCCFPPSPAVFSPSTVFSLLPLPFSLHFLSLPSPPFPSLPCCRLSWSMACYQPSLRRCWPSWPPQLKMMTYQTRVYSPSPQSPLQHRYSPKEKDTQWIVPFHCYKLCFIICRFWTS